MIKIYHNPRCRKSREGLELLENSGKSFEIIKYLDNQLTVTDLKDIIDKLHIKPIELVRRNEAIWKSDYKGKIMSDDNIVEAMVNHPNLIERPIIVNGNNARIGRPAYNIFEII